MLSRLTNLVRGTTNVDPDNAIDELLNMFDNDDAAKEQRAANEEDQEEEIEHLVNPDEGFPGVFPFMDIF